MGNRSKGWNFLLGTAFIHCAACMLAPAAASAQAPAAPPGKLIFRSETIDLSQIPSLLQAGARFDPAIPYVIQLDGPMTRARREVLSAAGVKLQQYLPVHAYITDLSAADANALVDAGFVTWVGVFLDAWKLSPTVGKSKFVTKERRDLDARGRRLLVVHSFTEAGSERISGKAAELGGKTQHLQSREGSRRLGIELDQRRLETLLKSKDILFVDEAPEAEPRKRLHLLDCPE